MAKTLWDMKESKRIDNKIYGKFSHHKTKKLAEKKAEQLRRKHNFSARVLKAKKGYDVYVSTSSMIAEHYRKYPMGL